MSQYKAPRNLKRRIKGSLPENQKSLIFCFIVTGVFLMAMKSGADYLFADNPVYLLGGVPMLKKMDSAEITDELRKKFPQIENDIEYAKDILCIRAKTIKWEASFPSKSVSGEWIDFEGFSYENPRNVLVVDVFVEKRSDPIKIVFYGDSVLLHKS